MAKHKNVIFVGPPGVGKSHLGTALAVKACMRGYSVLFSTVQHLASRVSAALADLPIDRVIAQFVEADLVMLDELGFTPLNKVVADHIFRIVSERYERGSIIVTSNKPFEQWGEMFADPILATAVLDRLVYHAHIVPIIGDSYRTKEQRAKVVTPPKAPAQKTRWLGGGASLTEAGGVSATAHIRQRGQRSVETNPSSSPRRSPWQSARSGCRRDIYAIFTSNGIGPGQVPAGYIYSNSAGNTVAVELTSNAFGFWSTVASAVPGYGNVVSAADKAAAGIYPPGPGNSSSAADLMAKALLDGGSGGSCFSGPLVT